MTGIDPALASALVSRIDALLSAVDAPTDAKSAQALDGPAATQWANAQPTAVPDADTPPPASAQAVLSQTARALDVISRGADGEPAPPVVGRQALWPASPAAGVQGQAFAGLASSLAMALEQALDTSGLFYESHLVQWLAGQRSGALLSQEPQSQLPGAGDEDGWSYDAEAMLRELADSPAPFMGERAVSGTGDTGSETIDVEIDDGFPDTNGTHATNGTNGADGTTGLNGTSGTAVSTAGNGAQPGAQPGDVAQSALPRLTQAGDDVLDALLLDDADGADGTGNADAGTGTSLVLAARTGEPANADAANGPAAQAAAARAAPSAPGYTPTSGSMLFANAGNAAYAAQAAAQVHPAADAMGSAADRAATAAAQNDPTLQASGAPSSLPIHPDALSIVRQQLEMLQSAEPQFRWSGEAWPDSRMYWELDWDPDDKRSPDQRVWRTRIAIELPTLGLVDAELILTGHHLGARITANGGTISTLKEGTSDFMRALAGAGLNLEQLAIRHTDGSLPASRASGSDADTMYGASS